MVITLDKPRELHLLTGKWLIPVSEGLQVRLVLATVNTVKTDGNQHAPQQVLAGYQQRPKFQRFRVQHHGEGNQL